MGDGDINANGSAWASVWCEEVYIEGAVTGMIWDLLGVFTLDIMFGLGQAHQGGKVLEDGEESVSDVWEKPHINK
jgi:hypothetical protein